MPTTLVVVCSIPSMIWSSQIVKTEASECGMFLKELASKPSDEKEIASGSFFSTRTRPSYKTVSLTRSDRPAGAHRVISSWQKNNAPKQNFDRRRKPEQHIVGKLFVNVVSMSPHLSLEGIKLWTYQGCNSAKKWKSSLWLSYYWFPLLAFYF